MVLYAAATPQNSVQSGWWYVFSMAPGNAQMVEQGLQVLAERRAQARTVLGRKRDNTSPLVASPASRVGASRNGRQMRLDLRPDMIGHLRFKVAHSRYLATQAQAVGPYMVNGTGSPRLTRSRRKESQASKLSFFPMASDDNTLSPSVVIAQSHNTAFCPIPCMRKGS